MSKITKRRVEALEPGQTAWDSELKGFGVRCRGSSKSYVLKYRYYKRQRMYTIGRHGSPWTPESARDEAKRLLGTIAAGNDPAGERKGDMEVMTLAEVAEVFMKHHVEAKLKPNTIYNYKTSLNLHIIPNLGKVPIHKISRRHVTKLHRDMIDIPISANQWLMVLSKIFNWAEHQCYLPEGHPNPCKHVDKYKTNSIQRFLTSDEVSRLHKVLDETSLRSKRDAHLVCIVRLILYTGARKSEILALKWSMVDLENRCLHLEDSKTGPKDIQLSNLALEILIKIPKQEGSDFVSFCWKKGKRIKCIRRIWDDVREAAGIADVRLHDLRHTFASLAVQSGMSLYQVGKLLGHKQPQTTARYAHLDASAMQDDVNKIGQLLQGG